MPDLTNDQLTVALAVVAGVALITTVVLILLLLRVRRLRRIFRVIRSDGQEGDLLAVVGRSIKQIDGLNRRLDGIVAAQEEQSAIGRIALQKFGLVRYDAFEEMGGRLSFSAALLDDHGDGLVLTSINGRTETRTYAKPIKNLSSDHNLSDEEQAAIENAAGKQGRDRPATVSP